MKLQLLIFSLFLAPQMLHAQWAQVFTLPGDDIQFLATAHNRIWVKSDAKYYFSDDQGKFWQPWILQANGETKTIWVSQAELLAVSSLTIPTPSNSEETIFRSTDNGDTWQAIFYDTLQQYEIWNAFSVGGTLFFVDSQQPFFGMGLFRSFDNGATWTQMDVQGNGTWENQLLSATAGGSALIASVCLQDGIGDAWCYDLKSVDFGQTWTGYGIPNLFSEHNAIVLDNCWIVRKAFNAGTTPIYVSFNSASSFSPIPAAICHNRFSYAPPNTIYSHDYDCLHRWEAASQTWQAIEEPPIDFFYFVQTEQGTMIAGTHGNGLWRALNTSSTFQLPNNTAAPLVLTPNPALERVHIDWPADTPAETPFLVFDGYGKLVLQVGRNQLSSQLEIDISTWPSGIYMAKAGSHVARLVKQ